MQAFKNKQGKMIGKISDGIFSKRVKKSKHLLRKWEAWGMDKTVLDTIVREGLQEIVIYEIEENIVYSVSVKDFVEKGIRADFGHSNQIFLPLINFNKEKIDD